MLVGSILGNSLYTSKFVKRFIYMCIKNKILMSQTPTYNQPKNNNKNKCRERDRERVWQDQFILLCHGINGW